jgi:hypothetical protein
MKGKWQHRGAFVIQFNDETDLTTGKYQGRVEHVESCRALHFYSMDELLSFLDQVLKEVSKNEDSL